MAYVTSTWSNWTTASTTAITVTCDSTSTATWYHWNTFSGTTSSTTTDTTYWSGWCDIYEEKVLTKEQEAERERIVAEQRVRAEAYAKEYRQKEKEKEEKARELLREVLTDEQDKQLDEKGFFELTSIKSGNRYRINKGRTRNVELLNADGTRNKRLCFHPDDYVHNYDTLTIQALMLANNEEDVLKVANYS